VKDPDTSGPLVALSRQEKIDFFNERISASIGAMTLIVDIETPKK